MQFWTPIWSRIQMPKLHVVSKYFLSCLLWLHSCVDTRVLNYMRIASCRDHCQDWDDPTGRWDYLTGHSGLPENCSWHHPPNWIWRLLQRCALLYWFYFPFFFFFFSVRTVLKLPLCVLPRFWLQDVQCSCGAGAAVSWHCSGCSHWSQWGGHRSWGSS